MSKINWNEENTAKLVALVGNTAEVSQDQLVEFGKELGTTARSVGAKLRKMEYVVAKAAARTSAWSADQEATLTALVTENEGKLTYAEIAVSFENGIFTAQQVQGKLLSMELFGMVRKADRVIMPRKYSKAEETKFVTLVADGASMEKLAEVFDKPISSVRGKALSLLRSEDISAMPKQEVSNAASVTDIFEDMDIDNKTVEEIALETGKSERGIKSTLSRRGLDCSNYKGAARRAKLDESKTETK